MVCLLFYFSDNYEYGKLKVMREDSVDLLWGSWQLRGKKPPNSYSYEYESYGNGSCPGLGPKPIACEQYNSNPGPAHL